MPPRPSRPRPHGRRACQPGLARPHRPHRRSRQPVPLPGEGKPLNRRSALALAASLALAGCAGNGPLGNGLGTVVGDVTVTDAKGQTCHVTLRNGKDQTNLELVDLHVCGASIGSLHADRSDGAQAAIAANAQVVTSIAGQLVGLLGSALTMLGVPTGHPRPPAVVPAVPPPPPAVVPAVPPPPPAALRRPMAAPHGRPAVAMLEAPDL